MEAFRRVVLERKEEEHRFDFIYIDSEKQGEFLGAFGEQVNVRACQEGGRARPVSEGGREGGKEREGGRERGRRGGKGGRVVG